MSSLGSIKGYLKLNSVDRVFIGLDESINPEHYLKVKEAIQKYPIRIIDVAVNDSGYLCVPPDASCLIDVRDKSDVGHMFLCDEEGDILLPPGLDDLQKVVEFAKRANREGGYNNVTRSMVIAASLCRDEFYDGFLFTKTQTM